VKMEERIEPLIETVAVIQSDLGTEEMTEVEGMAAVEEEMEREMERGIEEEMEEEEIVEMTRHVTDVGLDRRQVVTMATILVRCHIAEEVGEAAIIGEEEMMVSWVAVLLLFLLSLLTGNSCPLDAALGFLPIIPNSATSKLREKECCSNKTREWK